MKMLKISSQKDTHGLISFRKGHRYMLVDPPDDSKEAPELPLKDERKGAWSTKHVLTLILSLVLTASISFIGGVTLGIHKPGFNGGMGWYICRRLSGSLKLTKDQIS